MKPKASIYGPWVNRRGEYFPKAPPGIVLLRLIGAAPFKDVRRETQNKNQSKR
jgi:hypothetical protein